MPRVPADHARCPEAGALRAARRAARRAHAPYSRFRVGAALLDRAGEIYFGANVENAAYPVGICAERVALLAWLQAEGRAIGQVVIHTQTRIPTPPCGMCRDALAQLAPDASVFLSCRSGLAGPFRGSDWLPGRVDPGSHP